MALELILLKKLSIILIFSLSISSTSVFAQEPINSAKSYNLDSQVLNEKREFYVYLPPSYSGEIKKTYPVIYILDGDKSRLLGISGVVESLSTNTLENQIQEFIIVAFLTQIETVT